VDDCHSQIDLQLFREHLAPRWALPIALSAMNHFAL
jgi:citrate lyase synthetase